MTDGVIRTAHTTILLSCKTCSKAFWHHPGGRCMYGPFKFDPGTYGWGFDHHNKQFGVVWFDEPRDVWTWNFTNDALHIIDELTKEFAPYVSTLRARLRGNR